MAPEEISALRLKLGLTKAAFAREIGVYYMTIYRWESGKSVPKGLSLRALEQLAQLPGAGIEAEDTGSGVPG